jgi:HlyD family secretion protein
LKQKTRSKQQYEFAQKSIERYGNMLKDSLVPSKPMMKYLPNIKEHRLIAVQAELDEAKKSARIEQQTMARGQKERAIGALQEAETADQERYIVPQDMSIETITLNP